MPPARLCYLGGGHSPTSSHVVGRLGRRSLLGAAMLAPSSAQAAIPMMEEFYQGNGAQIARPKEEVEAARRSIYNAWKQQEGRSLSNAVDTAILSLNAVEPMLKQGDFDGIRNLLVSPSVGSIGIVLSPSRAVGKPFGAWADDCSKSNTCESSIVLARAALQQLEEWCFSKRAFYFNSADKAQVEARKETGQALRKVQENLEDPLEFLEQAQAALEEVRGSVKS